MITFEFDQNLKIKNIELSISNLRFNVIEIMSEERVSTSSLIFENYNTEN